VIFALSTTSFVSVSNSENVPVFEEQKEKFKKEARRLRRLRSEHIVKVHDLFEENGTAYYEMDYIEGESLAERMKHTGTPFTEAEVDQILVQVLGALKEVHQSEIWHLDLKPGNIMLDNNGKAYLIDFGASKQIRSNGNVTTSTALCYTPGYAPNEQIGQMFDRLGPWTDIYALGATLYNLLTNQKPPMTVDIEEDEEDAFDFPPTLSEKKREMIVWMMQPKRKARPQSVDEILSKLKEPKTAPQAQKTNSAAKDDEATVLIQQTAVPSEETVIVGAQQNVLLNAVDLGLSNLWADYNAGANTENLPGDLYDWNTATAKVWGNNWRLPSREDWKELVQKRTYVALAEGSLPKKEDTITTWLTEDKRNAVVYSSPVDDGGDIAITHYKVLRERKVQSANAQPNNAQPQTISLLELNLETGRTNQIRVHLASIGHPVVGDRKYGHGNIFSPNDRLCLHARVLEFIHPATEQIVHFETPIPKDF
jgi:serine/threonine protein kinase